MKKTFTPDFLFGFFFVVVFAVSIVILNSSALGNPSVGVSQTPFPLTPSMWLSKPQEKVEGSVVDVLKNPNSNQDGPNISILVLDTKNSRLRLQLGPTWQATEYEKLFQKGRPVSAVGFRFEFRGEPIFLPKEINTDTTKILFPIPDQIGFPTWKNQ